MLHPAIRIACVVCLAGLLARPDAFVLVFCGGLVIVAGGVARLRPSAVLTVLGRLRYLLLMIAVLYGWASPGTPLWPALGSLSPSAAGLWDGALRVLALAVLVAAVQVLWRVSTRGEMVAALRWWLKPLRYLTLPVDRTALRLVLAMEAVPEVGALVRQRLAARPGKIRRWRELPEIVSNIFIDVRNGAEQADPEPVRVPRLPTPPVWQWLVPLGLIGLAGLLP